MAVSRSSRPVNRRFAGGMAPPKMRGAGRAPAGSPRATFRMTRRRSAGSCTPTRSPKVMPWNRPSGVDRSQRSRPMRRAPALRAAAARKLANSCRVQKLLS